MHGRLRSLILACTLSLSALCLHAQTTTAPATQPTTRLVLVMPPGFELVRANGRAVVCQPSDTGWVKEALATLTPATRPTTMPADILAAVRQHRDALVKQITTELALSDPAGVAKAFDDDLIPVLEKYVAIKQPIFYMVATKAALKTALQSGWENPRFYYNRAADDVMTNPSMTLTAEREPDDVLLPAIYDPASPVPDRQKLLAKAIGFTEQAVPNEMSNRTQIITQAALGHLVMQQAILPLKLRPDQEWFGYGVAGYLSTRYTAPLTGVSADQLLWELTYEPQRSIVRAGPIDLLHPVDASALRPAYVPFHDAAVRRKAIAAIDAWLKKAGGVPAIAKTLDAIRKHPPADGPALVKLIQDTTGVDVGPSLAPKAPTPTAIP